MAGGGSRRRKRRRRLMVVAGGERMEGMIDCRAVGEIQIRG